MIKIKFLNLLVKVDHIFQNSLRLLSLPEKIIEMIRNEKLSQGHAKILIGLENVLLLAEKIIKKKIIC